MASSQTTRNRLEKQTAGENSNTWGDRFNSYFADLLDFAIDGMTSFTLSGTKTLSANNYAVDEARARFLNITSGTGGTVTIPNVEKVYIVRNNTSGTVTFTTGSGTTADVATGQWQWVVCVAGNVVYSTSFVHPAALGTIASFAETTTAQYRANTSGKALSTDKVWAAADYVSLTDAATVSVDMSLGWNFTVTLAGNRALGAPTNTKNGQSGAIEILQDATGSRTLSYNSVWKFPGGSTPTLTTTANARDVLFYQVRSSSVILANLNKGFA